MNMSREMNRLKSIESWPVSYIDVIKVVQSGLYFTGNNDILECFACKLRLGNWQIGDDPDTKHYNLNPKCQLLILKKREKAIPKTIKPQYNIGNEPKYPERSQLVQRLITYKNWPMSLNQSADTMANAGFIYSGFGDKTMCYHCGGVMKNWGSCSDPWLEHAYHMPKCQFVIKTKGYKFIKLAHSYKSEKSPKVEMANEPNDNANFFLCKVCYEENDITCCVPCGHVVACLSCAKNLVECPICRRRIKECVKLFFT
ncbi:baculoviral IAP repeat-containing protein 7-B-like [Arctopsyche grandis]|uniref:baculoviral IAP repeat-containing protein 7-B-like n=1 Tax=Arctopsyche grandis TaxID=121162 RepID=UPI00406D7E8C